MKLKGVLVSLGLIGIVTFIACKSRQSNVANARPSDGAYYQELEKCGQDGLCRDRVLLDAILGNKIGGGAGGGNSSNGGGDGNGGGGEPVEFVEVTYFGLANCLGDRINGTFGTNKDDVDEFCAKLGKKYPRKDKQVGSIQIGGQCQNLSMQTFSKACEEHAMTEK
ncbi:MAG: hypothetical protein AB7T49_15745 [Oligoflexales bacterium]